MFFQHQYIYSVPISIPPLIVYPCDIFYLVPLILLYKWLVISLGKLWHFQICLISCFGNVFTPYLVYICKAILAVMGWAAKTVVGGLYIRMREICPTMGQFFPLHYMVWLVTYSSILGYWHCCQVWSQPTRSSPRHLSFQLLPGFSGVTKHLLVGLRHGMGVSCIGAQFWG